MKIKNMYVVLAISVCNNVSAADLQANIESAQIDRQLALIFHQLQQHEVQNPSAEITRLIDKSFFVAPYSPGAQDRFNQFKGEWEVFKNTLSQSMDADN